jgi:hypothetical protein
MSSVIVSVELEATLMSELKEEMTHPSSAWAGVPVTPAANAAISSAKTKRAPATLIGRTY